MAEQLVKLNVRGAYMTTTDDTLKKGGSKLANMLEANNVFLKDSDGCFFIDCDVEMFKIVLNFLKFGTLQHTERVLELYEIAKYLDVKMLCECLESHHVVIYEKRISLLEQRNQSYFSDVLKKVVEAIKIKSAAPNEAKAIYFLKSYCQSCFPEVYGGTTADLYANIYLSDICSNIDDLTLLAYKLCKLGYAKYIARRLHNERCTGNNTVWHYGYQLILLQN
ncbi:BTB/POZ domain-containing protein KCTD7-like [Ruditapes philippinarum]|uniref:BTB/POZ domain-containing protein KCTD7-like n=1 Tax=Ruditapes philippinarum TaxID=129788 RepID=UPI00295B3DB6|nr:BTB/POZ domain-containing protein KCTD7-like [Ruditapes philippinarum]